jgi:hypothetical protein
LVFRQWCDGYLDSCLATTPITRTNKVFFSFDGSDSTGDGSIASPYRSAAKAKAILAASSGDLQVCFRSGGVYRYTGPMSIVAPNTTLCSYRLATDSPSVPKPLLTRFEPAVSWSAWAANSPATGVCSTTVVGDVAWVKFVNDERTVFRKMATLDDCIANEGTWIWVSGTLYVHNFGGVSLRSGPRQIEYVYKNTDIGIVSADVPSLRIDDLRIEGFGSGTPGDLSYGGAGISFYQSGVNRGSVTNCEIYYNGRHTVTKLTDGSGGSLVVANCRMGWLVNDDVNIVSYAGNGQQELVSFDNTFVGGKLPYTNQPYAYASSGQGNLAHTSSTSLMVGFFLCVGNRNEPGPYQNGTISSSSEPAPWSDLKDCTTFVLDEDDPCRTPDALDATHPSLNGGDGLIYFGLGSANTVYENCRIEARSLWCNGTNDRDAALLTSANGIWINSVIDFDFSAYAGAPNSDARTISPPGINSGFNASFYNCWINFTTSGATGYYGFSGSMVHLYSATRNNLSARWQGSLMNSVVTHTGVGAGAFYMGFGNDGTAMVNNAYPSDGASTGAWGFDLDPYGRMAPVTPPINPGFNSIMQSGHPQQILGYTLGYDRNYRTRSAFTNIGPDETIMRDTYNRPHNTRPPGGG